MRPCRVFIMEKACLKTKAEERVNYLNRSSKLREKQGNRISRTLRISTGCMACRNLRNEHKPEMSGKKSEDRNAKYKRN
jgi:hypothetical protein